MDFNFSCKIHHTKVYRVSTKVVVVFTRKLAKLVSHFSDFSVNLYAIYKLWPKHTKKEQSFYTKVLRNLWTFTTMPLGQKLSQMYPQRRREARRRRGGTGEGNKRAWAAIGLTCARLRCLVRPERSPASGGGGSVATRPRRRKVRQRKRHSWARCGTGSSNVT
jgi:hypothetical protein